MSMEVDTPAGTVHVLHHCRQSLAQRTSCVMHLLSLSWSMIELSMPDLEHTTCLGLASLNICSLG